MAEHQGKFGSSSGKNKQQLGDWANLPVEILDVISDKLFHVADYVRFGAVSKSWNFVSLEQKQKRIAAIHQQPPILLCICVNRSDVKPYLYSRCFKLKLSKLYSISESRFYKTPQLETHDEVVVCLGSSYGWLVIQKKYLEKITLTNLFNQKSMDIPGLPRQYRIHKIIMSRDPSMYQDDFILIAICHEENYFYKLALFAAGEKSWTIVRTIFRQYPSLNNFADMIFHKGSLYMVDIQGRVIAIDCSRSHAYYNQHREFYAEKIIDERLFERDPVVQCIFPHETYLVEASNGDLLLVQANHTGCAFRRELSGFKVYKMEIKKKEEKSEASWEQIFELDNYDAIFLASNSCFCINAGSSYSNCNRNSIYFAFNYKDKRYSRRRFYPSDKDNDIGVYNLGNRTMSNLDSLKTFQEFVIPIALLRPSLC